MRVNLRSCGLGLLMLAAVLFVGWRAWWVPNDLVLAHGLRGAASVRILFYEYERPTPVPVATLAGRASVAPLVEALDRPLQFSVSAPGCGDWFEIVFEREDGTSYSLEYHHRPQAGTLVYHKGEQVGSARAPHEFHAAMAEIVEPFLARHGGGCGGEEQGSG